MMNDLHLLVLHQTLTRLKYFLQNMYNLTYKQINTERVIRWRLILEEYSPELVYIQGSKYVVAEALSKLELKDKKRAYPSKFRSTS